MNQSAQRDLKILTEIAEQGHVTQRGLSQTLGVALGLTNLYLKRLARKGYIKITTIPSNRVKYLLTPKGIAQKTRLTYEYMAFSLYLYQQTRRRLREALQPLSVENHKRVALYGTGEAAELAYLTLRELGIEPVGIYDGEGAGSFLAQAVRPAADLVADAVDRVIVAVFESPAAHRDKLERLGLPRERLIFLALPDAGASDKRK